MAKADLEGNFTPERFEEIVAYAKVLGFEDSDARRLLFAWTQNPDTTYVSVMRRVVELTP